ncbi:hypothetical protein IYQ_00010 [Aeromonas salmonicida subsp. salmonicida 01-B526]|uniref:Uncharacterized protein n=1 Tax=Aeromonas salmonicida subsp. salmonicida 01-B526 TaxID=1076135 RepID=A0ABP2N677_AERSS|nr:hypothetical protein IYQ_00010 [Aeromonas salmonicida subsp. salmonicida 01-B526]
MTNIRFYRTNKKWSLSIIYTEKSLYFNRVTETSTGAMCFNKINVIRT